MNARWKAVVRSPRTWSIVLGVVFAIVHLAATVVSMVAIMYGGMGGDLRDWVEPLFVTLSYPMLGLISHIGGIYLPPGVLFGLLGTNSILWAAALVILIEWLRGRRRRVRSVDKSRVS